MSKGLISWYNDVLVVVLVQTARLDGPLLLASSRHAGCMLCAHVLNVASFTDANPSSGECWKRGKLELVHLAANNCG